eukprot:7701632-Pyramimonas_sp.AAC.1
MPNWVLRGACGRSHWVLRWKSVWGHGALYWVCRTHADGGTGTFGGAPLWGHETLYWVCGTHSDGSIGSFGGAPQGATKRCVRW